MDIVVLAYMCIYIHVCVACMRFVQSYQDRVLVKENLLHLAPLIPFLVKHIINHVLLHIGAILLAASVETVRLTMIFIIITTITTTIIITTTTTIILPGCLCLNQAR